MIQEERPIYEDDRARAHWNAVDCYATLQIKEGSWVAKPTLGWHKIEKLESATKLHWFPLGWSWGFQKAQNYHSECTFSIASKPFLVYAIIYLVRRNHPTENYAKVEIFTLIWLFCCLWHNSHHKSFQGKQKNWTSVLAWLNYGCLKSLKNGTSNSIIWYLIFKFLYFPDSSYDKHEVISKKIIRSVRKFQLLHHFQLGGFFALHKL